MQGNDYECLNGSSRCQLGYLERIKMYLGLKISCANQGVKFGAKYLTGETKSIHMSK